MSIKISIRCFVVYFVLGIAYSEICNLPDGGIGKCVNINACPRVAALATRVRKEPKLARYVRSLRCGSRQEFNVCCHDCYTPEGKMGTCLPIQECPDLMSYAYTDVNYVRNSICTTGPTDVCCGPVPAAPIRGLCESQLTAFPPDPATECCGIEASGSSRIVGGSSTKIDQYPWLVLLEYTKNNEIQLLCGGSLISNKYVVTAAHCVPQHKLPVSVRVGEFDIGNEGKDCVSAAVGDPDCTFPAISVPIKRIISHPEYDSELNRNDIALIELQHPVNYTDFVRPICLPSVDISDIQGTKDLYVAGWGKISWNIQNSRLKQHVQVPLVQMQDCQDSYHRQRATMERRKKPPTLWSRQLCAGGEEGRDSCNGDSGGPLMLESTHNGVKMITLEGLVSFGPNHCGTKGMPGIYTKVFEYNTWIRRNIEP